MFDQHINEEIDQFVDAKKQIIKEIQGLRDKEYDSDSRKKCMCSLKPQSRLLHRKMRKILFIYCRTAY